MVETTKIFGAAMRRERERETETERQRDRERQRDWDRERNRDRERQRERAVLRDYRNYPRRRTVLKLQRDFQRDCYEQLP